VTLAKDKTEKDKEDAALADRLEAVFFDWDENGIRENSASQPPPTKKKKKPKKKKKKKKRAAEKAVEVEAAQDIKLAEIKAVLAAAEPFVPPGADDAEDAAIQAIEWDTTEAAFVEEETVHAAAEQFVPEETKVGEDEQLEIFLGLSMCLVTQLCHKAVSETDK